MVRPVPTQDSDDEDLLYENRSPKAGSKGVKKKITPRRGVSKKSVSSTNLPKPTGLKKSPAKTVTKNFTMGMAAASQTLTEDQDFTPMTARRTGI